MKKRDKEDKERIKAEDGKSHPPPARQGVGQTKTGLGWRGRAGDSSRHQQATEADKEKTEREIGRRQRAAAGSHRDLKMSASGVSANGDSGLDSFKPIVLRTLRPGPTGDNCYCLTYSGLSVQSRNCHDLQGPVPVPSSLFCPCLSAETSLYAAAGSISPASTKLQSVMIKRGQVPYVLLYLIFYYYVLYFHT